MCGSQRTPTHTPSGASGSSTAAVAMLRQSIRPSHAYGPHFDKLTTAMGTDDNKPRPYRYGYGYLDENMNMQVDPGEKKVYFEISDYATNYVFFENPR